MPQAKTAEEIIRQVREAGDGYHLVQTMQDLSRQVSAGDGVALEALAEMLHECREPGLWAENGRYCSAVVHAVGHSGALRSMKLLIDFSRALPPAIPYGVVELLAAILPTYRRIIFAPARELVGEAIDTPARAVGLQTLCNLYLDHGLQGDQIRQLEEFLRDFERDNYLTENVADLVRLEMAYRERDASADLEKVLRGYLVENQSDGAPE